MKKVILFTLNSCGRCVTLKEALNEFKIPFEEYEVGANPEIWQQVIDQTGNTFVPTVFLTGSNEMNTEVEGFIFVPGKDFDTDYDLIQKLREHYFGY